MFDTHDAPDTLPPSIATALRQGARPARGRDAAVSAIMDAVRHAPAPRRGSTARSRLLTLRPMRPRWALRRGILSPAGAAMAACLMMAMGWLGALSGVRPPAAGEMGRTGVGGVTPGGPVAAGALRGAAFRDSLLDNALVLAIRDTLRVVRFVLEAPAASRVALVGDFTGWGDRALPLRRAATGWTADVALPVGRHRFAYVIDDTGWVASRHGTAANRAVPLSIGAPHAARFVGDTI